MSDLGDKHVVGKILCAAAIAALLTGCNGSGGSSSRLGDAQPTHYEPTLESLDQHQLPAWWKDGKFGIFIHWGIYSVPAWAPTDELGKQQDVTPYAEWYGFKLHSEPQSATWQYHLQTYGQDVVYDDFIPQFTAERFDPDAWVRLFEEAGAKYFVLTSKHHDGFALWPTATSNRNSMVMEPHRDLVGELFAAAHRANDRVKPGLYYSIPEWYNPASRPPDLYSDRDPATRLAYEYSFGSHVPYHNGYTGLPIPYTGYIPVDDYATGQVIPQIHELIERYHPDVLWCDIGGRGDYFQSNQIVADFLNAAQMTNPDGVVVNDRCGDSTTHGDHRTPEYAPGFPEPPFESTRGMGFSFGYNAAEADEDYLSPKELIKTLVDAVAHGGNLLLDIGPAADGSIPAPMVERLQAMGDWLRINGEAIYGSRMWSQVEDGTTRFTVGAHGTLYIIALEWPGTQLTVNAPVPLTSASRIVLLGSNGAPLAYQSNGSQLTITMPANGNQAAAATSEHAFVFRVSPVR